MTRYILPALLILAACSDGGATDIGPSSIPVALRSMVGDAQVATVATELPIELSATVVDASGAPVRNAVVSWVGDGSVFAPATGTGNDGVTRNQWTLDTRAGTQQMQARWVDPATGQAHVLGTFTAEATPDVAATFTLAQKQVEGLVGLELTPDSVVASAVDRYGNVTTTEAIMLRAGNAPAAPLVRLESEGVHRVAVIAQEAQDTVIASVMQDLSQYRWRWDIECRGTQRGHSRLDGTGEAIDSAFFRMTDSGIRYEEERTNGGMPFEFTDPGIMTIYWSDGVVTSHPIAPRGVQFPGSLHMGTYGLYRDEGDGRTYRTSPDVSVASCGLYLGKTRSGVIQRLP